jgi:hypothetical protein
LNHRELAEEEAKAWLGLYPEQRRPYKDGIGSYWKVHAPDRSEYQVTLRHAVWRAHNEMLWAEVDAGMPIGTAAGLVRKARASKLAIEECIQQYKSGGTVSQTLDGRVFRKRYASKASSELPQPPSEPPELADEWKTLHELIEGLARRSLSGEDPTLLEPLFTNFLIDVKDGIDFIRRTLHRKCESTVSRQMVLNACRFLNVEPPAPGAPANADVFRKNAKRMRYETHQDRLGAAYDPAYYLSIGRALDCLESYNQMIGGASCPQTSKT